MTFLNTETGDYPLTAQQVRARFPNVTFAAADFPPAPYVAVQATARPAFDALTQDVVDGTPVLLAGVWTQAWIVVDVAPEVAQGRRDAAIAAKWEAIKAKRDSLSDTGGYLVEGKWFHSDAKSKTQQLSLFIMGANVPAVAWKTMDGSFVTMTQTLAGQIFNAAAAQDQALFTKAEEHRAAMEASADPAAYDFSAGWPATYGG